MLYVQLDTNWPDHPKIIDAGMDGAGLHAVALCLVARSEDGTITRADLVKAGGTEDLIDRLLELELIYPVWGGRLTLKVDYIERLARRWVPLQVRRAVFARDGDICRECGATDDLSLDHIVPHSRGGEETVENLRVLCRPCNSRKGNRV